MIDIATKGNFDLSTKDDILRLRELKSKLKYIKSNSIEYACIEQEIENFSESIGDIDSRRATNLQILNAELHSHGIRRWGFNKSFMVSDLPVHTNRESEFFIYVPMWAATESLGLPSSCGNSNQRQLTCDVNLFLGSAHEGKVIEINHANGAYSAYRLDQYKDNFAESNFMYWMSH